MLVFLDLGVPISIQHMNILINVLFAVFILTPNFFSQWMYFSRWTFTIFCCRIIFASSLLVFGEYLDHRVRYTGEATRQCVCSVLLAMLRLRAACGRALCFRCSPSPLQPFTSAFPLLLICRLLAQIPWSLKLDIKASSRRWLLRGQRRLHSRQQADKKKMQLRASPIANTSYTLLCSLISVATQIDYFHLIPTCLERLSCYSVVVVCCIVSVVVWVFS